MSRMDPSPGVFVLAVSWDGEDRYWSSRPADATMPDGEIRPMPGGLDVSEWTQDLEILTISSEQRSLPVTLDWPGVAAKVARGHRLDCATAELSILPASGVYADRIILLRGWLSQPEYGADGEPVRASIDAEPYQDRSLIPSALQRVGILTWAPLYDTEGETYPLVYGAPGAYSTAGGAARTVPGSPARVVVRVAGAAQTLLIAGHEVEAAQVTIFDAANPTGEVFAVTQATDLLGQVVSTVDVSGAAVIDLTSDTFWVCWDLGVAHPLVRGLGTLVLWLLRTSSIEVDPRRAEPVCRLLDRYQVGGYISEPCHPWDHLQDLILDLAGVTLVQGPEGAYPVVWDLDAPPEHARCHLVAGESVVRTSGPRYDRGRQDYRSELRLRYAIPADSGTTQRLHVHSGYEWESYSSSPAAIRGHLAYGRQSEEADAPIVWEDSTAAALASRWVRWRALPLLVVEYDVLVEEVPQDPVGAQVLLTDADVSISSRVAYVRSVTYTDGTHSHLVLVLPEVI